MQAWLRIEMQTGADGQIRVQLDGPAGKARGAAAVPFTRSELSVVLRALEIHRGTSGWFTQDEVADLRAWGAVLDELKADPSGRVRLAEADIHSGPLLAFVQARLYLTLFPTAEGQSLLKVALASAPPGEALHIQLEFSSGDTYLPQCPWEVLCYQSSHLWENRRVGFSRHVQFGQPRGRSQPQDRLNVLVISSRPKDLPEGPGSDAGGIARALRRRLPRGQVQVRELPRATSEVLSDYLFEHADRPERPSVVHFEGHGDFGRLCPMGHLEVSASAERCRKCDRPLPADFCGYLAFEGPYGSTHWVSADTLADVLLDHRLKLVVLNACNTAVGRRGEDVFNGLAQSLIRRGIPAVVATPFPVDWEAAVHFAGFFYQHLGQGDPLIEALDRSRQRLQSLADTPREWYRFVLYVRWQDEAGEPFLLAQPRPEETAGQVPPAAPLIHVYNFGDLPGEHPDETFDWRPYFDRGTTPRIVPDPRTWERVLLPQLKDYRERIGHGLIRLRTTAALSTGLAVGHVFSEVGKYRIEVTQSPPTPPQLWLSDEPLPEGLSERPDWSRRTLPGDPAQTEAVMVVSAIFGRDLPGLAAHVGTCLGEAEVFRRFFADTRYDFEVIQALLADAFSPEELKALSRQRRPFARLGERLAADADPATMAGQLVNLARRRGLEEELLDLIRAANPRQFRRREADLRHVPVQSAKFKGALFLAYRKEEGIQGWEAAALSRASRAHLAEFVRQVEPRVVHLFLATPLALAVFLGHQWNAVNTTVLCYEFVAGAKHYAPCCRLELN